MIIAHPDLNYKIELNNKMITEWIIESPALFSQYLSELYTQMSGGEGNFILSNEQKELILSKNMAIIFNPFEICLNEKKIVTKIYTELQEIAMDENCFLKTKETLSVLQQYLLDLEFHYDLSLHISEDIDLQGLFKLFGIKIVDEDLTLFEQVLQYIKLQSTVLGKKLIILVNSRSFFTEQQLEELSKFVEYNEFQLLLIESIQRDFTNLTKKYIIDKDECEI